jgi:hypothetical protein
MARKTATFAIGLSSPRHRMRFVRHSSFLRAVLLARAAARDSRRARFAPPFPVQITRWPFSAAVSRGAYRFVLRFQRCLSLGSFLVCVLGACSSPELVGTGNGPSPSLHSGRNGVSTDGGTPFVNGAGTCPARGNATACPAPPSLETGSAYWVGCQVTSCATTCTVCTCFRTTAGTTWDCVDAGGLQPDTDAQPTPYCALYSGPIDVTDLADAGPFEQCTPQYPTCTIVDLGRPLPSSAIGGWECCALASLPGAFTQFTCMPNEAGAYNDPFPPP